MIRNDFHSRFLSFVQKEKLFGTGDAILVAFSGGVDSAVLAHLLKNEKISFALAHCNFLLRGNESDEDLAFCEAVANKYEVPFYFAAFDTKAYAEKNKYSIEEAARNLRYQWLEETRNEFGYRCIATAHHLNDSAETFLINFIRGTGIDGLQGIPVKNKSIIRPLLFASRQEIEVYAKENNLYWRTDSSNISEVFTRNKIRNKIIPILKEINPAFENTFAGTISHLHEASAILHDAIDKKLRRIVQLRKKDYYIPIASLLHLASVQTYLHAFLYPLGFGEDSIQQICFCMNKSSGKIFNSHSHRLIVDRKFLIITASGDLDDSVIFIEKDQKNARCVDFRLKLETIVNKKIQVKSSPDAGFFDGNKLMYPLILRRWKKGDYLYPTGLKKMKSDKPGKKKVSDILIDAKTDLRQKEKTWVLLSGEKIIWIPGMRQDERFRISDSTNNILKIKLFPPAEENFY